MKRTPLFIALLTAGACVLVLAGCQDAGQEPTTAEAAPVEAEPAAPPPAATLPRVALIPRDHIFGNPERAQGLDPSLEWLVEKNLIRRRPEQLELLDHLVRCPSCRDFTIGARSLDGLVATIRRPRDAAEPSPAG